MGQRLGTKGLERFFWFCSLALCFYLILASAPFLKSKDSLPDTVSAGVAGPDGGDATPARIYRGINSLHNPYAGVSVNIATPGSHDPGVGYYMVTVEWVDRKGRRGEPGGFGNVSGERVGETFPNDGAHHNWDLLLNYPGASSPYSSLRFKLYGLKIAPGSVAPFTSGQAVLEKAAWAGHSDLMLDVGSAPRNRPNETLLTAGRRPSELAAATRNGALLKLADATTPTLSVTSLTTFNYQIGGAFPPSQAIGVTSSGAQVSFTALGSSVGWLIVSPSSATTPAQISVSAAPVGLAAGSYGASVTIDSPSILNGPIQVGVQLVVTPAGPLKVSCTPAAGPATVGVSYSASCTASGGVPPYVWSIGSGSLPGGLSFSSSGTTASISGAPSATGTYSYSVTVTDNSIPRQTQSQGYSGTINQQATPTSLTVAPAGLNFTYRQDDAAPPAPQSLSIFSSAGTSPFSATSSTASGGNWLSVAPGSGQTPSGVSVSVGVSGLTPGTYSGQIIVSAPAVIVPVTLTIVAVPPPQLSVAPTAVTVTAVQGEPAIQQQLMVTNLGGGTLNFTAASSGGAWLVATSTLGTASAKAPAFIGLSLDPTGLNPGTYRGLVVVRTSDGTQSVTVPVTMTVNALPQTIVLTQTGLQFTAVAQGTPPPAQSFSVLNGGLGTMNWNASAQTVTGGNWLSLSSSSGSATGGVVTVTPVGVNVSAQGLSPGTYYGLVQVTAQGAGNSPQLVSVVLNVVPAGQSVPPAITSVGLLPVGVAGGPPATDSTTIYNLTNQPETFVSTVSTQDGGSWLSVTPASGSIPASGSLNLTVQVNASGLTAGVRNGLVRLSFSDGTVSTLTVVSVLGSSTAGTLQNGGGLEPRANGCTATSLALTLQSLQQGFSVSASQAVPMQAKIVDNCGNAIQSGATVSISFSNKDTSIGMVAGNGTWNSTWTPRNAGSNVVVLVTAFVVVGQNILGGQAQVTGTVSAAGTTAAASPALIANSASYLLPGQISPGSWVSIFGDRLADTSGLANTVPFPNTLDGTQVALGQTALPVQYVSAVQVNALIPYSLSSSANRPLVVQRNGTSSVPLNVTVTDVLPAIYSANQSGTGQGAIQVANSGILAAPVGAYPGSRPVQIGEYLQIYASGLGPVVNTPADGSPAPTTPPLATTLQQPTVTIGGVPATVVSYSGLAPGLVGLYQINVQVPGGTPIGDAVPVTLAISGNTSNTVTIAVQAAQ